MNSWNERGNGHFTNFTFSAKNTWLKERAVWYTCFDDVFLEGVNSCTKQ